MWPRLVSLREFWHVAQNITGLFFLANLVYLYNNNVWVRSVPVYLKVILTLLIANKETQSSVRKNIRYRVIIGRYEGDNDLKLAPFTQLEISTSMCTIAKTINDTLWNVISCNVIDLLLWLIACIGIYMLLHASFTTGLCAQLGPHATQCMCLNSSTFSLYFICFHNSTFAERTSTKTHSFEGSSGRTYVLSCFWWFWSFESTFMVCTSMPCRKIVWFGKRNIVMFCGLFWNVF